MNLSAEDFQRLVGQPLSQYACQCHQASIALVRTGALPKGARVARGSHPQVFGQHSWIVLGDPYAVPVTVIDPTLWNYTGQDPQILTTVSDGSRWRPYGQGSIWEDGRPRHPTGQVLELTPATPLSRDARHFLKMVGPLDQGGWMDLASSPVEGWPAAEIIAAMDDTPGLSPLVPIDILGMLTDRNPDGLYLPAHEEN